MAEKRKKPVRKKKTSDRDVSVEDIEDRIFDVEEVPPYVRLLAYAENGKGKTRLGASFPNALIIDINEEGTRSAKQFKGTKVFPANDWEDIVAIYWYLQKGEHDYETVVIDTITQMHILAMRNILENQRPPRKRKDARIQDWGAANDLMGQELLQFRNLPMHVIFLAQERVIGDPEEGEVEEHVPDLPAGARKYATAAVGIIGRLYLVEKKTKDRKTGKRKTRWLNAMLVGPHEEYITKDRTGALGRIVYQPSGPKIIEAWEDNPPGEKE